MEISIIEDWHLPIEEAKVEGSLNQPNFDDTKTTATDLKKVLYSTKVWLDSLKVNTKSKLIILEETKRFEEYRSRKIGESKLRTTKEKNKVSSFDKAQTTTDRNNGSNSTKRCLLKQRQQIELKKYCEQSYSWNNPAEYYCDNEGVLVWGICLKDNHNSGHDTYYFIQPEAILKELTHEENILFLLENGIWELNLAYLHRDKSMKRQYEDLRLNFEILNDKFQKFTN